ncbi:hypothetical protein LPW11_13300 [Geomonas sp. RF6]|uniref:hypothetical protein n=1 Tax=Geomonas sp. RF6 TaxID=2897342 RepID=UPI001E530134|nr:hypothetical protein [Geomonas sp. RF6]UFS68872.1 hypothetical protein LPW11_13300 [Geomonas sp. RF6]
MGFEKKEPEKIRLEQRDEPVEPEGASFTVVYDPWKKVLVVLFSLVLFSSVIPFFVGDLAAFEVIGVIFLAYGAWYVGDCLFTREFTFAPDRVVKKGLLGRKEIPADALIATASEQKIRLCPGTAKNLRESVTVRGFLIHEVEASEIERYAASIHLRKHGAKSPHALAITYFEEAASSYLMMAGLFILFGVVAIFTAGISENAFTGLAPTFSADLPRFACIVLAILAYLLLRAWAPTNGVESAGRDTVTNRLKQLGDKAFRCAVTSTAVAALGLVLLLMFANMLDFYVFLLVGVLYFWDFYPRLSTWDKVARGEPAAAASGPVRTVLPRRSLQVSLVLMGTLAVMSYGESRHFLYATRKDCTDDWGEDNCEEAPTSGSHGGVRYYRPRYQSGGGRATRAVGVQTISRGGFGSLGRFHASFGGG